MVNNLTIRTTLRILTWFVLPNKLFFSLKENFLIFYHYFFLIPNIFIQGSYSKGGWYSLKWPRPSIHLKNNRVYRSIDSVVSTDNRNYMYMKPAWSQGYWNIIISWSLMPSRNLLKEFSNYLKVWKYNIECSLLLWLQNTNFQTWIKDLLRYEFCFPRMKLW